MMADISQVLTENAEINARTELLSSSMADAIPRDREAEVALSSELAIRIDEVGHLDRSMVSVALSDVQIRSKLWLLEELFRNVSSNHATVVVLGGWFGTLPWLANLTGVAEDASWCSVDIDAHACAVGQRAFGYSVPRLTYLHQDIHDLDYDNLAKNNNLVVVNTVCEHLAEFSIWRKRIPKNTLVVLQSNNFRGCPDHVNCVDSVGELLEAASFNEVVYQGALELSLFTRFMVIGRT